MDRIVRIPVRVVGRSEERAAPAEPEVSLAASRELEASQAGEKELASDHPLPAFQPEVDWRDRALRLQAEMDNFRKRQQRMAQDEIRGEREKLLRSFLEIVDDLERALTAPLGNGEELRDGIELTRRSALRLLEREGVERLDAEGQPFDPAWHEAVAAIGHDGQRQPPGTVVGVVETGYRLGDQLLRPAKVVVAV